MKATKLIAMTVGLSSLMTLPLFSGEIGVQINVPIPVVTIPAPTVAVQTVPDSYAWDGTEYVGVVGSQYYYLGPDHVWLTLDGSRRTRFHDWEQTHADWRTHAVRNERYRSDAHGHNVPLRDAHDNHDNKDNHDVRANPDHQDIHANDHGHDNDHH